MDHESLRTASTYLNNLLLARGFLRNGEPIDFVKPSKESRAQIINLVHDLILREDRDKEQRELVANTIRQLRSEDARKSHEIERLQTKSDESARAAVQAQQAERVADAEVKKVEKAMKALQDQTAKLKITLAQVKTQCANDVKKRDLELARLKTHLQGQQRGTRVGMAAPSMTVRKPLVEPSIHDIEDPAYSLKQETTEFLTQLSQSLSDENDGLISLIRDALSTMQELLGLPANVRMMHPDSAVGSMHSNEEVRSKNKSGNEMLQAHPTSYETLAAGIESTLSHLKTILTNPNFVPMEEVEVREEEIVRLREGWEHMENRWREVLLMMQGWVRRMNTGDTINMEDLRKGMGLVTPSGRTKTAVRSVAEYEADNSLVSSETGEIQLPSDNTTNGDQEKATSTAGSPRQIKSQPRRTNLDTSKRKRDVLEPPELFDLRPSGTSSRHVSPPRSVLREPTPDPQPAINDDDESEELEIPQMTIAEKLSAAREEAEQVAAIAEAARASGARAARREASRPAPAFGLDGAMDAPDDDTLGKMPGDDTLGNMPSPMGKKARIKGRPRKRKSTLSPEELEALLSEC